MRVIEKLPVETEFGARPLSTGTGFQSVTALSPEALGSAVLTADTVTVFVLGRTVGATNMPPALIVPVVALPPVTPFTCHVTDRLDVPVTVAVNAWDAPARTVTGFGETETPALGGGFTELLGPPVTPAQPLCHNVAPQIR